MLKELQEIGLSEKESRVYLASLEIGAATAEKISSHSKVNRSTTYVQLESLMKQGLMSTFDENKKAYFVPESPELLARLLEKQKDKLSSTERDLLKILPLLLRQYEGAGERPLVRFFLGEEGITTVREEVLTTKQKTTLTLLSFGLLSKIYSQEKLDSYVKRRKDLGIHSKAIYTHTAHFDIADLDSLTDRRFIPPGQLPLTIDMTIFDNKTAIYSLKGSLFAMVIESKQLAQSMRMIFEFLWSHAEGPNSE